MTAGPIAAAIIAAWIAAGMPAAIETLAQLAEEAAVAQITPRVPDHPGELADDDDLRDGHRIRHDADEGWSVPGQISERWPR